MGIQVDITDGLSSSVSVKGPCKAATSANVTLSGEQTINSIACVEGDRVLCKDQTTASQNGIYVVSTGDWERAKDFSRNDDVKEGTSVYVTDGTLAGLYVLTTANPIVFDTSSIAFSNINLLVGGALLAANNFSDLASAIDGWDALARHSGSVQGLAGVLDLSTATAPVLQLLSGAITSITLGSSKVRLLRVSSSDVLITPSSTLVVNGQTSGAFNIPRNSFVFVIGGSTVRVWVLAPTFFKGADIVSAATITLAPGAIHHVTGSTGPITDIDFQNAADGAAAWVIFDSTPTITHNATTLKLPGGVSIVAAAGDRALFVQDSSDNVICLEYVRAATSPTSMAAFSGLLYGLALSNNVDDATNDIDIAAGVAMDSTNAVMMTLAAGITKRLDAAWAVGSGNGGLDTGAVANGTYHMWLIMRSDTGVVDVLFSTSASAPTMPTSYDYKRRIGSIVREGAVIVPFTQNGDVFRRKVQVRDVSTTNPGTSAVTATLSVPTGIVVEALMDFTLTDPTPGNVVYGLVTALDETDSAPSVSINSLGIEAAGAAVPQRATVPAQIKTNTSGQCRYRLSLSNADHVVAIYTEGWVDGRGRSA